MVKFGETALRNVQANRWAEFSPRDDTALQ
jgi:hypothetical protein